MTWSNRLRLAAGLLVVLAVVAVATVVLNQRIAQATSTTATIRSTTYDVGTDFAGTLTESFVVEGDAVSAGDELFAVQSLTLEHALSVGLVSAESAAYEVEADGTMTLLAPANGIVTDIPTGVGSFLPAGTVVATVERADSLFVDAHFTLDPRDYARVEDDATVVIVLPNQAEIVGEVAAITVQNIENQAESTVEVRSADLVRGSEHGLITSGTPVTASLQLRDDGALAGVGDSFGQFLRKVGL
ncbi:HlyD family efflux transporter periplasmic adaptor subunit [Oerskovia flava]|uniref:HlyD family efflux transporter periplasmic adaptor subunit n=1 Tax=Oerskovia flava TaxID=2986422 RepID=UPI002240A418|nr:HlyD family efflux transporter periplasmic adaptor subunit [Oerskovia sp. JB1-3-2]